MTEYKKLVCELLGQTNISVRKGRGTAYNWISIETQEPVPINIKEIVESELVKNGFCGRYFSDSLPGNDTWDANVSWSTRPIGGI